MVCYGSQLLMDMIKEVIEMASVGTIEQYNYYNITQKNNRLELLGHCIIGISISEDDYMILGCPEIDQQTGQMIEKSFRFIINGQQIWMGRTYMYQTEKQLENDSGEINIIEFPDGVPISVKVEVVYCSATS